MNRYILFIFSLLISTSCSSQKFELEIDSIINLEIRKLEARKVNEFGYTKLGCINFGITTTAYLFWNEDNNSYIQKFEDSEYDNKNAQKYQPISFIDSVFFTFFKANRDSLIREKVKIFSYKSDSVFGDSYKSYVITTSHSCYRNFKLNVGDIVFNKNFDFFNLREFDEDQIDNSKLSKEQITKINLRGWDVDTTYKNTPIRNINFETNNELKIVKWVLLLSKFIDTLESENEFIEIKD